VRVDFSKPCGDIAAETDDFVARDDQRLARQRQLAEHLAEQPDRKSCVLCANLLSGAQRFDHRGTIYVRCSSCGQVQTHVQPPQGYPYAVDGIGFEEVYPKLDHVEYVSRRDRIYAPKRDWILSCLQEAGHPREEFVGARWQELGCGAGYFLSALRDAGIEKLSGIDQSAELLTLADEHLGPGFTRLLDTPLADIITKADADVFVAFFVFEHLEDAHDVWAALAKKPTGTVFAFSVPVFGFTTLLESAFPDFSARNLDGVVHTQLYTDRSIEYALKAAGYTVFGEWVFGQDALDLKRLLMKRLVSVYDVDGLKEVDEHLGRMVDDMQGAIDRNWLADARHVVAIKD
jgi:hypothetical protein